MNAEEMKSQFDLLYKKMATSKDVEKMKAFGESAYEIFEKLCDNYPSIAKEWLDSFESMMWNNYLSQDQAAAIASGIINQDGTHGPHWSMDTFFGVVPRLGGQLEDEPYYNKYALWLVANAHYSDFAVSTAMDIGYKSVREVPEEKMALSMYRKAVESLKDVDRKHYIRDYYRSNFVKIKS